MVDELQRAERQPHAVIALQAFCELHLSLRLRLWNQGSTTKQTDRSNHDRDSERDRQGGAVDAGAERHSGQIPKGTHLVDQYCWP